MIEYSARVSVFGGRRIDRPTYQATVDLGELMAREGWLVFCGGSDGVMEAIAKGVQQGGGTCVGVLKSGDPARSNPYLTFPLATGMGLGRNVILAYNCDVAVAIAGKYGTLSEIAYALQLGKPVVGMGTWDLDEIIVAKTPNEVIAEVNKILSSMT